MAPDHAACPGTTTHGPCACNCHYTWELDDLVRLMDGRVGMVVGVGQEPEYVMVIHLGGGAEITVDVGEPVLLDQSGI